jgi:hypothetical protein
VSGAGVAACSAGSPVGGGSGGANGTGAAKSTGGSGSTMGTGGSGSGPAAGGTSGKGGTTGSGGSGNTGNTSGTSGTSGSTGGSMVGQVLDCPSGGQLGSPAFRLMTRTEFDNTINDIFPSVKGMWTDSLPANITVASGFDNDAGALVGNQMASNLLDTALSIATAVTGSGLQNILSCASTTKDHACAKTYVDQIGARLFRRSLTSTEETRYLTFFDTGLAASDFPTALKWVTVGLIQSPNSIYRSEIGTVQADGTRKLTPTELATELAYTFSGTTPTADLLAQFAGTSNPDPSTVAASLLQTANGQEVIQHFFEEYLTYTGTAAVTRTLTDNPSPGFADVAADMLQETRSFVSNVVLTGGGSIADLLTSNKTYPSANLAKYYGFPTPGSDGSVTRPSGQGIGILAQGSFLSTHANTGYSSPTQRGLFPYYRLMCQPKLTPPNNVPPITDSDTQAATTTRQLYETTHLAGNNTCKSCHAFFDPIGFGFENFDQGGRYRTTQNGQTIDPSGQALDPNGNVLFTFTDQADLAQKLATQLESSECFAAYMATYAFGSTDACLGPSSAQGLNDGSTSIVKAFAALASEKNFTQRNGQ